MKVFGDTNRIWGTLTDKETDKETGGREKKRRLSKLQHCCDQSENEETGRFEDTCFPKTPMEDHQLTLVWKTLKVVK